MNERIVYTNPDGSVSVLVPTGAIILEDVAYRDVPYRVTADISFPDGSVLTAGGLLKIADFYVEGLGRGLTVKKIGAVISTSLKQLAYRQITIAELPQDRLFRAAWDDSNPEDFIGVDITKAKDIAHSLRRTDREVQLTPLDREENFVTTTETRKTEIIAEKQGILDANATMQTNIDGALDEAALRSVIGTAGLPNVV